MIRRDLAISILLSSTITVAVAGTVKAHISDGKMVCDFGGEITKQDVAEVRQALQSKCGRFRVSSPGGDVDAAIAIGRILRSGSLSVVIPKGEYCASACVFLYAGGVARLPFGPVMIHRPYLTATDRGVEETRAIYRRIDRDAKAFLRDMNVQERLFDMMMAIPPEQSKSLALDDMEELGMGIRDPVALEHEENRVAAHYGIRKAQWLEKKARAVRLCGSRDGVVMPGEYDGLRDCWLREFPQAWKGIPQ
tara:strand:+ start:278 stop:1027 length:750 start_codon:yes stop_codon:yes gene_type:complete